MKRKSVIKESITDYSDLEATITNYGNNVDISDEVRGKTYNRVRISADLYYDSNGKLVDPDSIPTGEFRESNLKKSIRSKIMEASYSLSPMSNRERSQEEIEYNNLPDGSAPLFGSSDNDDVNVYVHGSDDGGIEVIVVDTNDGSEFHRSYSENELSKAKKDALDVLRNGYVDTDYFTPIEESIRADEDFALLRGKDDFTKDYKQGVTRNEYDKWIKSIEDGSFWINRLNGGDIKDYKVSSLSYILTRVFDYISYYLNDKSAYKIVSRAIDKAIELGLDRKSADLLRAYLHTGATHDETEKSRLRTLIYGESRTPDKKNRKNCTRNKMTKKECDDPKKIDEGALSEFTKTDWYAYAGADRFEDGSSPLIHENEDFTVVVSGDPDGGAIVEVDINGVEDTDEGSAVFTKVFGSKKEAVDTAESLIDDMYNGNAEPFDSTWSTLG